MFRCSGIYLQVVRIYVVSGRFRERNHDANDNQQLSVRWTANNNRWSPAIQFYLVVCENLSPKNES